MSEIVSREEVEARISASESRMELRYQAVDHKLDILVGKVDRLHDDMTGIRQEVKSDYSFTRWTIAGIIIAAVGALWVTQANLIAALALVKG